MDSHISFIIGSALGLAAGWFFAGKYYGPRHRVLTLRDGVIRNADNADEPAPVKVLPRIIKGRTNK